MCFFRFRYTLMSDSFLKRGLLQNESTSSAQLLPGDMTPGFHTPASDIDMKKIGQVSQFFPVYNSICCVNLTITSYLMITVTW